MSLFTTVLQSGKEVTAAAEYLGAESLSCAHGKHVPQPVTTRVILGQTDLSRSGTLLFMLFIKTPSLALSVIYW